MWYLTPYIPKVDLLAPSQLYLFLILRRKICQKNSKNAHKGGKNGQKVKKNNHEFSSLHLAPDMWHVTYDMCHLTHIGWWILCQHCRSIALMVWVWRCLEDSEQKDHWLVILLINQKCVFRTALATLGLLIMVPIPKNMALVLAWASKVYKKSAVEEKVIQDLRWSKLTFIVLYQFWGIFFCTYGTEMVNDKIKTKASGFWSFSVWEFLTFKSMNRERP